MCSETKYSLVRPRWNLWTFSSIVQIEESFQIQLILKDPSCVSELMACRSAASGVNHFAICRNGGAPLVGLPC